MTTFSHREANPSKFLGGAHISQSSEESGIHQGNAVSSRANDTEVSKLSAADLGGRYDLGNYQLSRFLKQLIGLIIRHRLIPTAGI